MNTNLDTLERELAEFRTEARGILDRADGDLCGDDAQRFDALTGQIDSHNTAIRDVRDRRDRAAELVRAVRDPSGTRMRLEAGSPGADGVQPSDPDRPPQTRDLGGQRLAFDTGMAATLTRWHRRRA